MLTLPHRRALLGGATAFSPAQIPGLALWLKADTGLFQDAAGTTPAVADADPVGLWSDLSGNGNNVSQATSTKRPSLKLTIQNGQPVVRFDGVDDSLASAAFAAALAQPVTVCIAYAQPKTNNAGQEYTYDGTSGASGDRMQLNATDATRSGIYAGTTLFITESPPLPFQTKVCLYNGTSSQVWRNGVSVAGPGNAGAQSLPNLVLGRAGYTTQTGFGKPDVGEVLVYSGDKSANVAALAAYLRGRWGTP